MIYRETGQFKTSYRRDQAIFPIAQDRWFVVAALGVAFVVVPLVANEYWLQAVLIPWLVFSIAAIGLNLLTGYAGQLSLGTGGFMAVGAYAVYKLTTAFPELNVIVVFLLAGLFAAGVGILFGLPSLRIKGLYLAVATLAAQFFLIWLFNRVPWFFNYNPSGTITMPPRTFLGVMVTGPEATATVRYLVALSFVVVFALLAKNLVRTNIGRTWMAIRDMDVAAEIIGIRPLTTKLSAFAVSSFYCGLAGALVFSLYLGSVETLAFDITVSFEVLFMIIIGGLGSILGSILGAGFIVLVPIFLTNVPRLFGIEVPVDLAKEVEAMVFGGLIVFFLIVEPLGLARLWQIAKEKLRRWPFPY
ncbi:MAG: branched-chain amino acid ABC transporter permease [Candidatus Tectimicrobiota bacterium]|nr:MAG: branched-chain amino acid ABC transporter permease [Candidatus Tectomicrobia bacterium]